MGEVRFNACFTQPHPHAIRTLAQTHKPRLAVEPPQPVGQRALQPGQRHLWLVQHPCGSDDFTAPAEREVLVERQQGGGEAGILRERQLGGQVAQLGCPGFIARPAPLLQPGRQAPGEQQIPRFLPPRGFGGGEGKALRRGPSTSAQRQRLSRPPRARVILQIAVWNAALATEPAPDLGPTPAARGFASQKSHEQFPPFLRQVRRHLESARHEVEQKRAFVHPLEPASLREHLQHDHAQTPPVRRGRAGASDRLRRGIARRLARASELEVKLAHGRRAEIRQDEIQRGPGAHEHIRRFQIPVDELHLGEAMQRPADFAHRLADKLPRRPFRRRNRAQGAQRQILPNFKGPVVAAARIEESQAMVGIQRPQRWIKRCFRLDPAPVVFEDRPLTGSPAGSDFAHREEEV